MWEQFSSLVSNRKSVRMYQDRPVEPEKTERILEAARLAPSACNAQPWTFVVVDKPELKEKLAATTTTGIIGMNRFTKQAPLFIVLVMEPANFTSKAGSLIKQKHFPLIDIGIAASHISLAAVAEGLGTCMVGWFDEPAIRKLLGIPKKSRPVLIITLGYPVDAEVKKKWRKPFEDIVRCNQYKKEQ